MDIDLPQPPECAMLGGLVPHSCDYCQWLAITCSGPSIEIEFTFPFEQVLRAARNGCRLFKKRVWRLNDLRSCLDRHLEHSSLLLRVTVHWDTLDFHEVDLEWLDDGIVISDQISEATWSDKLHVFALDGDPAASYITARPLYPELASNRIISLTLGWLQDCRRNHAKCRELTKSVHVQGAPSRLLDVGLHGTPTIRLHVNCHQNTVSYAALSYCWGGDQNTKTTTANQQERLDKILLASLPKTIQDAVDTSRRLGFRYLWVDALCIIQDDEDDWGREVGKMSRIYEGASITISAARASCSNLSVLQERDLPQIYAAVYKIPCRRVCEGVEEVGWIMLSEGPIHNDLEEQLDSRGWALQEALRSPRVLRFGSRQLEWICQQAHHVDGGYTYTEDIWSLQYFTGTPKDKLSLRARQSKFGKWELDVLHNDWTDLVSQYSKRRLSKLSDRLPAFAAIAESFADIMQWKSYHYLAGLWEPEISMQLLWRRPTMQSPDDGMQIAKRSCPSWSWASVSGEVFFGHQRLIMGEDSLEDIRCNINLKCTNVEYGEVELGRLTVRGYIRQVYWTGCSFVDVALDGYGDLNTILPIVVFWDLYNASPQQQMWCLEVNTHMKGSRISCGLILTVLQSNIFTRVGYFEFGHPGLADETVKKPWPAGSNISGRHSRNSNWFHNDERQTIHII